MTASSLPPTHPPNPAPPSQVLILKSAPGTAQLYYTAQARNDVAADLIRPCVHALKTEFHLVWELEKDGTPYTASQQVGGRCCVCVWGGGL